jgi:3'-5' exonuclease
MSPLPRTCDPRAIQPEPAGLICCPCPTALGRHGLGHAGWHTKTLRMRLGASGRGSVTFSTPADQRKPMTTWGETGTMKSIIVWDLETIPDLKGFAAANGHDGKTDDEVREALGDKFPKHIYHSIICIGALIAHQDADGWVVDALGAPHVGERSERELIAAFVDRIAELNPQLVTFNGSSFDLPVLRYRAMVHKLPAVGLSARPYFHRYTDDAIDLCDVLSSFAPGAKATLHELCRVMGLPGKPNSIDGGEVEKYFREGRIREIAEYCESDVVNTYRLWLRHELFQAKLTDAAFQASETNLEEIVRARRVDVRPRTVETNTM